MSNKISAYSYVIHPEDGCVFSEEAYIVSREDDGAGEYFSITDGEGNKIKIDPDDIDDIVTAIGYLKEHIK